MSLELLIVELGVSGAIAPTLQFLALIEAKSEMNGRVRVHHEKTFVSRVQFIFVLVTQIYMCYKSIQAIAPPCEMIN